MTNCAILLGKEQYKKDCLTKKAKEKISMPEYDIMHFSSCTDALVMFLNTMSFGGVRLAILSVKMLDELDNPIFMSILESDNANMLLVNVLEYDKRKTIYKKLVASNKCVFCEQAKDECELNQILMKEVRQKGCVITPSAMQTFIKRTNYFEDEAVTLYTVVNLLYDLCDYTTEIDDAAVEKIVPITIMENIFSLSNLLLQGDMLAIKQQIDCITRNGSSIGPMSALLREFRLAWKEKLFSAEAIGVPKNRIVFHELNESIIFQSMVIITEAIADIKRGAKKDSESFYAAFLDLHRLLETNGCYHNKHKQVS